MHGRPDFTRFYHACRHVTACNTSGIQWLLGGQTSKKSRDLCPFRGSARRVHMGSPAPPYRTVENANMLGTILLIVLILLLLGAIPAWPHSRGWGYGPSGGLGLVLVIVLILVLMQRI
jgi:hypothetical protein